MSAELKPAQVGRLRMLRAHSASRFVVVGAVSVAVDVGTLAFLHGGVGVPVIPATVAAFALSSLVNFALNRTWTFTTGRDGRRGPQLARFYGLVVVNLGLTVGIVAGLVGLGVFYLAAKLVATVVVAALNYLAYRHWVFA